MIILKIFIILAHLSIVYCNDYENEYKMNVLDDKRYSPPITVGLNKLFEAFRMQGMQGGMGNYTNLLDKNPDIMRTSSEIIVSRGFQSEEHTVVTDDGYILGIFRIINPYVKPSSRLKPILLWHQMLQNSNQWLISTPGYLNTNGSYSEGGGKVRNNCGKKLTSNVAFTLAACGYDVWLGNTRGNRYSPRHMTYSSSSRQFADYSYTELGVYDAKNTIEFIMRKTNTSCIAYFGSSLGSTIIYTLLSMIPEFAKHVGPVFTGPTITFLGNNTSLFRYVTPLVPLLNNVWLGVGSPQFLSEAMAEICGNNLIRTICISLILRPLSENVPSYLTNSETQIVSMSIGGNYLSSKCLLQYGQFIINGRFSQFDYMKPQMNYQYYGQPEAPDYPLGSITSRNLVIFRAANDPLSTKADVEHLISSLTVPPLDYYLIKNPTYNHFDYPVSDFNNRLLNWKILGHLSGHHWKYSEDQDYD